MPRTKNLIILSFILLIGVLTLKQAQAASISINTDRTRITTGEKVTISGVIKPKHRKVQVTILGANKINGKYKKITTDLTNKKGKYSAVISPSKTKYIKASYLRKGKKIASSKELITVSEELSMITPYLAESDISWVPEAYSDSENSPWGFVHGGVDFVIDSGSIPVQAVSDGTVSNIEIAKEETQMGWHVGYCIAYGEYSVCYNLETFSQDDAIGDLQTQNIFITEGQIVKQGDIIANLIYGGSGAHIDFGVGHGGTRVCPEPFFTEEARESVMRLITQSNSEWVMCYGE